MRPQLNFTAFQNAFAFAIDYVPGAGDFTIMPNKAMNSPRWRNLSYPAREVYMRLRQCTRNGRGPVFPSNALLAQRIGCSIRTVQRGLKDLLALGFITRVAQPREPRGLDFEADVPGYNVNVTVTPIVAEQPDLLPPPPPEPIQLAPPEPDILPTALPEAPTPLDLLVAYGVAEDQARRKLAEWKDVAVADILAILDYVDRRQANVVNPPGMAMHWVSKKGSPFSPAPRPPAPVVFHRAEPIPERKPDEPSQVNMAVLKYHMRISEMEPDNPDLVAECWRTAPFKDSVLLYPMTVCQMVEDMHERLGTLPPGPRLTRPGNQSGSRDHPS